MRSPSLNATVGEVGRDDEVALRERGPEVVRDLRPHALRAPVVGLVVAGRERERAEHDPALHLVAEALRARALVQVEQRPVARPLAVADAVVAGQVRGRLGGRDHVVGRDAVRGVGKPHLHDLAAELARSRSSVRSKTSPTPGSTPSASEPSSRGTPNRRPCRSVRAGQPRPPRASPSDVESQWSCPTMWRSSSAASRDRARQRPALVERGRERDHPVARDRAVGRLQARRCRTATPAGGSSRRCRCRSPTARGPPPRPPPSRRSSRPARAPGPRGCARGRSRSSRSTSPSRTRPCSSCRASGRPRRPAAARRSRCRAGGGPPGSATRPWSARPRCRTGP